MGVTCTTLEELEATVSQIMDISREMRDAINDAKRLRAKARKYGYTPSVEANLVNEQVQVIQGGTEDLVARMSAVLPATAVVGLVISPPYTGELDFIQTGKSLDNKTVIWPTKSNEIDLVEAFTALSAGDNVTISGASVAAYNTTATVQSVGTNGTSLVLTTLLSDTLIAKDRNMVITQTYKA